MTTITVNEKEYKIRFGMNSFADTDILDRIGAISTLLSNESEIQFSSFRELFIAVRELVYIGCERYNPLSSLEDAGNLLDDFRDENPNDGNLLNLFAKLIEELTTQGFFGDLLPQETEKITKIPTDHKKSTKK